MNVQFRFITAQDAERIASWRYPPPYDFYNWYPTDPPEDLLQAWPPFIVADDGLDQLAGFACFGATARVPTDDDSHVYDDDLLDVGLGLRPDLVGHGHGLEFVNAIIAAASSWLGPRGLRLTVASFNVRAIRVYERAGFVERDQFVGRAHGTETEFVVMHRFNVE